MTYDETISWLETPDKRYAKADKEAFSVLMERLGSPQNKLRFVHVTGSNGKGSICVMLAEILRRSGYRTGLYTSPHLSVYNERCRVDGRDITDADLVRLADRVRTSADEAKLSLGLFYKMTAVSFLFFAEQQCDIVVLEVGRGGRRDCTNIVSGTELSVIGSVSLEHTEVLGKTLAEIVAEKSGIFRPGIPALMLHQSEEAMTAAKKEAERIGAALSFTDPAQLSVERFSASGQILTYRERRHLRLSCPGLYQTENVQLVLDAADILKQRGYRIPEKAVRSALSSLKWPGRFERLGTRPVLLLDGAHNLGAVTALAEGLWTCYPGKNFTFILTLLWDRPWEDMLRIMAPLAECFIAVETPDPKALRARELADHIRNHYDIRVLTASDEAEALQLALSDTGRNGRICVFGSLYLVGAVRDLFLKKQ